MSELLCLGEPLAEYGEIEPGVFRRGCGGDVSNVAVAAARQGAAAGVVGALGADAHGRMLRAMWAAEGVDATLVAEDAAAPTGVYWITHGPDGHAFAFLRAGSAAARLGPADLPVAAAARARVLHLSGISLAISTAACDAGFAAMRAARAAGGRVSVDTNHRPRLWGADRARAVLAEALSLADVALPGADDVATLTGLTKPQAQLDWVRARTPAGAVIVLKRGAAGALLDPGDGSATAIPAHPVSPVDATGAGDCFDGAFLARLLAGDDPAAAAAYAAVAAALSTQEWGAVAAIPRAEAVRAAAAGA